MFSYFLCCKDAPINISFKKRKTIYFSFKQKNMKAFLRPFLFIAVLAFGSSKSNAQCVVSDIIIQKIQVISSTANSCGVKFDVSFNIENNNGNKFIYVHAWLQNDYPNYFKCSNGQTTLNGSIKAPDAVDLGNTIFNLGLNNEAAVPTILTNYEADATVQMNPVDSIRKVVLADGSATIILYGVEVIAPVACGTPSVVVADLWSTQSAQSQRAHCVSCGIRYSAGFFSIAGNINCNRSITGIISNLTSVAISGYYKLYVDVNRNGYFDPNTDTLLQGSSAFSIDANGTTTVSGQLPAQNINQNVFVVITQTSGIGIDASRVFMFIAPQCGPLPVSFKTFTAIRNNHTTVQLKWETATELNNSGFNIERNTGKNSWVMVSFVPTQAQAGTTSFPLTYMFNDLNTNKGVTQYRIKQVDLDGKISFSSIQVVRGDVGNEKTFIYPNPSADGHVSVLFDDKQGIRDITLTNMNGQIIKQWSGITNNLIQIDNLSNGLYYLKVMRRESGTQTVEKIIVLK